MSRSSNASSTVSRSPDTPLHTVLDLDELRQIESEVQGSLTAGQGTIAGGERPTIWHGQGMEPIETRAYQPGDDIRHIDWRATARSGKPRSKVFADERRHSLMLLIDYRPTMHFASRGELKSRQACRCAALLAFAALRRREPVGAIVLQGKRQLTHYPLTRQLTDVIALLQGNDAPNTITIDSPSPLGEALARMATSTRPSSLLTLISDLHDCDGQERRLGRQLAALAARQTVHVLHTLDKTEIELPAAGRLRLIDDNGRIVTIDSHHPGLRQDYARLRQAHLQRLQQQCRQYAVAYQSVLTTAPLPATSFLTAATSRNSTR